MNTASFYEDPSSDDVNSSLYSSLGIENINQSHNYDPSQQDNVSSEISQPIRSRHNRGSENMFSSSSLEKQISLASSNTTIETTSSSSISQIKIEEIRKRIRKAFESLMNDEVFYKYYVSDRTSTKHANDMLKRSENGTFYIRLANEKERMSGAEYALSFLCHGEVIDVPICCDKDHRLFWFLSGYGVGAEVQRCYTGVDAMVRHKQENNFSELPYSYQICLYKPIDPRLEFCTPLPDKLRSKCLQDTLIHELIIQGSTKDFSEISRISKTPLHHLREAALFIMNKINGRNRHGFTPLILAILTKRFDFIDLLLKNNADVNRTDSEGRSPLHCACQQANSKLLKKLIDLGADPHYYILETPENYRLSKLSALHYLAMSRGRPQKSIVRCAQYLFACGCPLMPLTNDRKSPFDIAKACHNYAYKYITRYCNRDQFSHIRPFDVASRSDAKRILTDETSKNILKRLQLFVKSSHTKDPSQNDGVFLLYKTKKTKAKPSGEIGLCLCYNDQAYTFPISQEYENIVTDPFDPSNNFIYKYTLTTGTNKDNEMQLAVFRSCDELVYHHTKYKGILPTLLKVFIQKDNNTILRQDAETLLLPNPNDPVDEDVSDNDIEEETSIPENINSIVQIDPRRISSAKVLYENKNRLIWLAKVQLENSTYIPIIIKDYLPTHNIDQYKQYRFKELNMKLENDDDSSDSRAIYKYSSRSRREYQHESLFLLESLRNHASIVHAFICKNNNVHQSLRLFIEYLPMGNLNSYLKNLEPGPPDPLLNAFHWIYQLAQAMAFLSNLKIVHRDLATRNILLKNETHIKLNDFGLSRMESSTSDEDDAHFSPRWSAPECFALKKDISSLSDVWSFGVVIWEIYSMGATPYETDMGYATEISFALLKKFIIEQSRRLSQPKQCSNSMYDLMCRCWNIHPSKRPNFTDIINEFNGTNQVQYSIAPFTRHERKTWEMAKNRYLEIRQLIQTPEEATNHYITIADNDNDDECVVVKL